MTINQKNAIERWELMANSDLGSAVQPIAWEFSKIFRQIYEDAEVFGEECQLQVKGYRNANKIIREFICKECASGECSVVECADLNHIDITIQAADQLDFWLMTRKGWFGKYRFSLSLKEVGAQ